MTEPATTTHYQRLGVTAMASTEEIRAAYLRLAQRLHPDRMIDASSAERTVADRRMREINEAWQVLGDPAERRRYDQERLGTSGTRATERPRPRKPPDTMPAVVDEDDDLVDVMGEMGPVKAGLFRVGPWGILLLMFGLIFVVTAYATADDEPAPTSPTSEVGSCVDVETGPVTTVVPCDGPHELRIVSRIVDGGQCPVGTEKRRLADDGYLECVRME